MRRAAQLITLLALGLGCGREVELRLALPGDAPASSVVGTRVGVTVEDFDFDAFDGTVEVTTSLGGFGPSRSDRASVEVREGVGAVMLFSNRTGDAAIRADLGIHTATGTVTFVDPRWSLAVIVTATTATSTRTPVDVVVTVESPVVSAVRGIPVTVGTDFGYFVVPEGGADTRTRTLTFDERGFARIGLLSRVRGIATVIAELDGAQATGSVLFE